MYMEDGYNILNQLKSNNSVTYKVSDEYFEKLAASILLKIKSRNATYQVPQEYFETFASTVLDKIKLNSVDNDCKAELEFVAPSLLNIKRDNVYKLPTGYFENFNVNVETPIAKVVKLKPRFAVLKYAAAAIIITVIAFGGFFSNNSNEQTFALHQNSKQINIESSLQNLSDAEINSALESDHSLASNSSTTVSLPWNNLDDLEQEFKYISDEEISTYLTENNFAIN